ncbi:hypothetical protein KY308_00585 [Candidatus Woesearchaeota archaeon]|nr:hypothetical protein [Candidatus Woesearchaeota archaeon]
MSKNHVIYLTSALVTLLFLFVLNENPAITGHATFATSPEVNAVLSTLSRDNSLLLLQDGAEICVVVEVDELSTYYFDLIKSGQSVSVQESYCADPLNDNLIFKFNSYDDLLEFNSDPVSFIQDKKNIGYYIFPSNYVITGGEVLCTPDFQKKYCVAPYYYFTESQLRTAGMDCCAGYELTAEDEARINELKGKQGILEIPLEFLKSTTGIIVMIGAAVFIVIIASLIMVKPKNPLEGYVSSVRSQGYADEDIKRALLDSGWDEKTIDDALKQKPQA